MSKDESDASFMADFIVLKQDNEFFIIIQKDFISIFTGELEIFAKFGSVSFDVCDHKIIGEIYNKGDSDNFYYSNDEFELNLHLKKSNYKNKNSHITSRSLVRPMVYLEMPTKN